MIGDYYDLSVFMATLIAVCDDGDMDDNGDLVYTLDDMTRAAIVESFYGLLASFCLAESAHRAEHGVSAAKKATVVSCSTVFRGCLDANDE